MSRAQIEQLAEAIEADWRSLQSDLLERSSADPQRAMRMERCAELAFLNGWVMGMSWRDGVWVKHSEAEPYPFRGGELYVVRHQTVEGWPILSACRWGARRLVPLHGLLVDGWPLEVWSPVDEPNRPMVEGAL